MAHAVVFDVVRKLAGDITGAVIREQPRFVHDVDLVTARCLKRHIQRIGHISCLHIRTELPADNVAREVIEDCRQIHPSPANDFEVSKIGLPHLIDGRRLVLKLAGRLHHDKGWAGDQIMGLQKSVY